MSIFSVRRSDTAPDAPAAGGGIKGWVKRHREALLLWLRLLIAVGLMAFVMSLVYADRDRLNGVDWHLIPIAGLLILISTVVKAFRWYLLVKRSQMDVSFRQLLGSYLVGAFFSTLLPTSVGGDAVRAVEISSQTRRAADATSSVLVERGVGLLTVLGAGSLFALFLDRGSMPVYVLLAIHGMFIGGSFGFLALRQGWVTDPAIRLLERFRMGKLAGLIRKLDHALSIHLESGRVFIEMVVLSLIANALTMGATFLVLIAVRGDPIPPSAFVSMMSLATAAELIPISIAALGIKEGAYIAFLGQVEVTQVEAGVIAIIMRVLTWALAMLGGAVFLWRTLSAQQRRERLRRLRAVRLTPVPGRIEKHEVPLSDVLGPGR